MAEHNSSIKTGSLFLFSERKTVVPCALGLGVFLILIHILQSRLLILYNSFELYAGSIALVFTGLGIWLAKKLIEPKVREVIVEKEIYINVIEEFTPDKKNLEAINLSKRELEVLELIAAGLSNDEVAAKLFVSKNTIKTHTSNLFVKLDAKRRTQAVEKAKLLKIIPQR